MYLNDSSLHADTQEGRGTAEQQQTNCSIAGGTIDDATNLVLRLTRLEGDMNKMRVDIAELRNLLREAEQRNSKRAEEAVKRDEEIRRQLQDLTDMVRAALDKNVE